MPDRIERAALAWFSFTTVFFWLATVRGAFDGASYQWGLFGLGGRGVGGDYWFPVLAVATALGLLAAGWRRRPWAFAAMTLWSAVLLGSLTIAIAANPDGFRFRGDTLGIDISLAWIGPPLLGAGTCLCLIATRHAYRQSARLPFEWSGRNSLWLAAVAAVLPVQFFLLRTGDGTGPADPIGVLITLTQWFLLARVLRSYRGAAS